MCTYFTLTYDCGHTQTCRRCPRSTVFVYGANGEQIPQVNGCDNQYFLGANLHDKCVDCKMADGLTTGAATGLDKWAEWGPKEGALAARVKCMNEEVQKVDSPMEGGAMQGAIKGDLGGAPADGGAAENWEEQVRAVLTDQARGYTDTPETMTSSAGSVAWRAERWEKMMRIEYQEEEDDWMWGGMKDFGGEEKSNEGKSVP